MKENEVMPWDKKEETKVCSHCKQEKPVSMFYKSSVTKDGYRPQCIECSRESAKQSQQRVRMRRKAADETEKELKENKTYRKLSLVEKKQLLLQLRSDKPLSAYHPRELFEYLQSLGYKIRAEYTQVLSFG